MNKIWLEMVFPASMALLVCTAGVVVLTMTGLLEPGPAVEEVAVCAGPLYFSEDSRQLQEKQILPQLTGAAAATVATGEALFKGNCAQCHAVNDVVVGPALAGITKRRPAAWITRWVKNSSKMVASGDEYAVKIFTQ